MMPVSVVTGAAGAMGSACAQTLGASSDVLLLTDRDEAGLAATAAVLEAEGTTVVTIVGDVADPLVIDALVRQVADHGPLRALVHTAGLSPSMTDWEEILRVDLAGVVRLLDAFAPAVVPGSVAVCLASVSAHMGEFAPEMDAVLDAPLAPDLAGRFRSCLGTEPDPGSTYRLAKRGVLRACERAAVAWGASGGRVVSLSPGLIDTGMGRLELAENPVKAHLVELTPIHSSRQGPEPVLPGHTADIAEAMAFLCSERAAFVSGCDLRVDGGLIAAMNQSARAAGVRPAAPR
jgi:NAD(P)-dependent dehydrogenase (short-subunit alcohol dehydrogenase family)